MSIIVWNCRGARKAAIIQELHNFVSRFAPSGLCIIETKIGRARIEGLVSMQGYDHGYALVVMVDMVA